MQQDDQQVERYPNQKALPRQPRMQLQEYQMHQYLGYLVLYRKVRLHRH